MGLFNKMCKYVENEPGFKGGFRCVIIDEHLEKDSDLFKYYCDSYGNCKNCPYYV